MGHWGAHVVGRASELKAKFRDRISTEAPDPATSQLLDAVVAYMDDQIDRHPSDTPLVAQFLVREDEATKGIEYVVRLYPEQFGPPER